MRGGLCLWARRLAFHYCVDVEHNEEDEWT